VDHRYPPDSFPRSLVSRLDCLIRLYCLDRLDCLDCLDRLDRLACWLACWCMAELEHDWSLLEALAPELLDLCLSFVSGCDIAALGCTSTLWRCRAFEQRWDWWHGACCREFVPVLVLGSREPVAYLGDLAWWKAEYARRYLYTLARCCMCFAASARPFAVWQLGRYRLCARCCSTEEQLLTADKCRAKVRSSRRKALVDTIGSLPRRIAS